MALIGEASQCWILKERSVFFLDTQFDSTEGGSRRLGSLQGSCLTASTPAVAGEPPKPGDLSGGHRLRDPASLLCRRALSTLCFKKMRMRPAKMERQPLVKVLGEQPSLLLHPPKTSDLDRGNSSELEGSQPGLPMFACTEHTPNLLITE